MYVVRTSVQLTPPFVCCTNMVLIITTRTYVTIVHTLYINKVPVQEIYKLEIAAVSQTGRGS